MKKALITLALFANLSTNAQNANKQIAMVSQPAETHSKDCIVTLTPKDCYSGFDYCYVASGYIGTTEYRYELDISYRRGNYADIYNNSVFELKGNKIVKNYFDYHNYDTKEKALTSFIHEYYGDDCGYIFK